MTPVAHIVKVITHIHPAFAGRLAKEAQVLVLAATLARHFVISATLGQHLWQTGTERGNLRGHICRS